MRFTASTLIGDALALWRADRDVLTRVAAVFVLLPVLALSLLFEPDLARTVAAVPPDDTLGQLQAYMAWTTANAHWLLLSQIAVNMGALTIVMLYLDRPRPDLRGALRSALRYLPVYFAAMALASLLSMIGIAALVIGYFYVLARLSLVGPVMAAERQMNPFTAIGRSVTLTRGHGFTLTGVVMIVLLGGYLAQTPFSALDGWMAVHGPNPIARAIVDIASSAVSALVAIGAALVQVAAWRRLSPR